MELLKQLVPLLLTFSLALLVVAVGAASTRGDLLYVFRRPALLAKALLAVSVIPVLVAIAVIAVFPVSHATRAGIMLMAISPVPPLVPGKMMKFGGRNDYAYGLYNAMAALSVITVPLWGIILTHLYAAHAIFPPAVVASNVFIGVVIPLVIGLLFGRWLAPERARRAAPVIVKIAMALVILAFVPIILGVWPELTGLVGDGTIVAMAVIAVLALLGGHLLGGPLLGDRATLAFAAAMRHPGIALALAGANHGDKSISAAVLLFILVGMIVMMPYQAWIKRRLAAEGPAPSGA
ncbi:Na+-dependent transporter [Edaphosphingomonas haloaromaticamans]|uniref:Sodium Bile acid symporter family protein n=1 Tax=Edaphosphingomonas haloaromaticamans TaxID=653954 RepID=A0A1S1H951_9SPHN|nr:MULTISPECIES: Na+-dependent transporter [Sphingomonas]MDX3885344.1 Na+-dependent transporter [Sphingomonas sp.]OHT18654.1 Sodium Bile acid symporter family protein [Sphingomonas haloaromaticamans]